ncbi:MAG: discoidin domain-containing protein [Candidatus Sericytochromatia bacterium]|nr:discoidin domain-containing protein [Candidatus Tanganyikabacteria bacterium]
MLPGILTILAPVLVAFWALRRLRSQRLALRELRARFRETLDSCEDLLGRLALLEPAARVAALAPPPPGGRASGAEQEYVNLRESLRQVEESLLQGEGEWQIGRYDRLASRLSNLWAHLDTIRGGIDRLDRDLAAVGPVPAPEAAELLERRAGQEHEARAGQETEIRARCEREAPRLLARARHPASAAGEWAAARLGRAEASLAEALEALAAGDLVGADRGSRLARALAGGTVRLSESGLLIEPPAGRGPWAGFAAACREARVPPRVGLGWTLAAMALVGAAGNWVGHRLTFRSTEVRVSGSNLALRAPAQASHALDLAHTGARAVDGDLATTWQSGVSLAEPQAVVIDLGKPHPIGKVLVLPQAAPPGRCTWEIDLSADSWEWARSGKATAVCGPAHSRWGITEAATGSKARFVRVRPTDWGRSGVAVAEIRVFAPSSLVK